MSSSPVSAGRPPQSDNGTGVQKSIWFSPEAWNLIENTSEQTGESWGRTASRLVEAADPRFVKQAKKREETIKELRSDVKQRDMLISRLERDIKLLRDNSQRDRGNYDALETPLDLAVVHPRLRKRVLQAVGAQA